VVPVALSDAKDVLPFALKGTQSRLLAAAEVADKAVVEVQTRPLDNWVRERGVRPQLIKIDVEGAEAAVLSEARETLATHLPIVLIEILSDEAGERAEAELPDEYGFFRIDENRGIQPRGHLNREHWAHKNWMLVPKARLGEISTLRRT
jgi:hypothetical protein